MGIMQVLSTVAEGTMLIFSEIKFHHRCWGVTCYKKTSDCRWEFPNISGTGAASMDPKLQDPPYEDPEDTRKQDPSVFGNSQFKLLNSNPVFLVT